VKTIRGTSVKYTKLKFENVVCSFE
jgi:hypothetical protein